MTHHEGIISISLAKFDADTGKAMVTSDRL